MIKFVRRQVRKLFIASFVLAVAVSIAASVRGADGTKQWEGISAHRAVWKIIDGNRKYQASAFAVGPRLVVTVAHNLFDVVWRAGTDKMVLVQAGRQGHIDIVRARAISATHDLALLETAMPMEHHLTVARDLPHGLADQFHAAGYPKGRFQTLSVIAQTLHGDVDYYRLPMDQVVLGGISGAPILAPNGEVIAVQRRTDGNVAEGTRFETVQELLNGDTGVGCGSMTLKACLEAAAERTKQLAERGEIAAQYQLGRPDGAGKFAFLVREVCRRTGRSRFIGRGLAPRSRTPSPSSICPSRISMEKGYRRIRPRASNGCTGLFATAMWGLNTISA